MLRIKAFKVLYASVEDRSMTLKGVEAGFAASCEAVRDLYLFMLSIITALTDAESKRLEAGRRKFNPTQEDLSPNDKFASNALAVLLADDPDFNKILSRKKLSWEQYDVFIREVSDTIRSRKYFADYMASPERSLKGDVALFKKIFEQEFEDSDSLAAILEELSILWVDDLGFALGACLKSLSAIAKTGRWEFPPLYHSEELLSSGKDADSDAVFSHRLLEGAFAGRERYFQMVFDSARGWEKDRLFNTDLVLIAMGLAEAELFPDIPVRVTINEYVEISKFYSTPKSSSFVNGLLDTLIVRLTEEGRIVKSQKGLN
ncbi:MAG: hypothetical protein IK045_03165 [Bacteroidales bacterium]|nr:hypothetical protein [Bacteroidales bacterium]